MIQLKTKLLHVHIVYNLISQNQLISQLLTFSEFNPPEDKNAHVGELACFGWS